MSSGNDIELRLLIARAIFDDDKNFDAMPVEYHEKSLLKAADRILALPEIAEALKISGGFPENDFRDYLLKRGRWAERTDEMGYV